MEEYNLNGKRILVTGGAGFLGSFLVEKLKDLNAEVFVPRSRDYDLRREEDVERLFNFFKPEFVIHAAVDGGGIGYMRQHPGSVLYNNLLMNTHVLEQSRKNNVLKFIGVGTVCSYPKFTSVPFKEEDLWLGYPEETNAPYGLAKKIMMVQSQGYREQYGMNAVHLLLVNLYGPRDDFNPESSHVIPALIKKFQNAKERNLEYVEAWGTGKASREFLYVEDAAEGIILALKKYNKSDPINLGSGMEISIKDLTEKIAGLIGYKGEIKWDTSKPDGQPRRCLDISKSELEFGFRARTNFDEGLRRTVEWWSENKND